MCVYVCMERERERERETCACTLAPPHAQSRRHARRVSEGRTGGRPRDQRHGRQDQPRRPRLPRVAGGALPARHWAQDRVLYFHRQPRVADWARPLAGSLCDVCMCA